MKKGWHNYFIYLSLIFLVVTLYKAHYLSIPKIYSPAYLIISMVCLIGGFIFNALAQQHLLCTQSFQIDMRQALAMEGLNIFGKYLPGKVLMIVGKAMYLSEKKNFPPSQLSVLFFQFHIVALWCGLSLGIIGLYMNDGLKIFSWIGFAILSVLTTILLSKSVNKAGQRLLNKVLRKEVNLPLMDLTQILHTILWLMGGWGLWGCGFFLLSLSITEHALPVSTVFCFPLAATIGILFVFAPGGIGIRESVISGYMALLGVPLPEAITISAASRIWFLSGELVIFITGYLAHRKWGLFR